MLRIRSRPLTAKEQADLLRAGRGRWDQLSEAFGSFLVSFFVLMMPVLLLQRVFPVLETDDSLEIPIVVSVFVAAVFFGVFIQRRTRMQISDSATVLEAHVRRAARVQELEDEGIGFYLDVGDHEVVFLQGQYLDDMDEQRRFPGERIIYVREPRSGGLVDLEVEGPYVKPEVELASFPREAYRAGSVPLDGEVISEPFDSVVARHRSRSK